MSSDDEDVPLAVPLQQIDFNKPRSTVEAAIDAQVHRRHHTGLPPALLASSMSSPAFDASVADHTCLPPSPLQPYQAAPAPVPASPAPPVPVTLITGHLGAGKTTLVNYVLTAKHGYRCAVLLDEIADSADIERALVKEPEVRWVEGNESKGAAVNA
jgi:hypothetical protein